MTLPKLTVVVLCAALVASVLTIIIMLFSPVMAPSPHGEGTCGSLGGLILRGGETRNNGGDITSEQFDARIADCRVATGGHTALLLVPVIIGGFSWWGALRLSERNHRR